jgi:hypothetical protein
VPTRSQVPRRVVFFAIAALAGIYYFWAARATGHPFQWGFDLGGYYNYLARGFAHGHLYIEIPPSIEMHDMALFRGRYYLYHGAAPAVLLFLPWRLVTGHDVPENFALALFCLAGFLFAAGTLLRLLNLARVGISAALLAILLLALAFSQGVPFLLSRIWVYEIAIGCGYCCISAAFFFLACSFESRRAAAWLAASGLMFGFSIGCRPHLGLAALIAGVALAIHFARKRRLRALIPFLATLATAGLAIALYNYQRFGNPFEFGVRYLLGNRMLARTEVAGGWLLPGLYYFLVCPPDYSPVFPWVRLAFRYPFHAERYFLEPTAGAFFVAPLLIGLVWSAGLLSVTLLSASSAILLFIAGTGFTSQRYEADFLPVAVLAAAAGFAFVIARRGGWKRRALTAALIVLALAGVLTNLALGLAGPYDEFLKNRPESYARIARWFSPIRQYRPLLSPSVDVEFTASCMPHEDGFREPLLAMGRQTFREIVFLEHHSGKFRVVAQSETSSAAQEIDNPGTRTSTFHITYRPEAHRLSIAIDGHEILAHDVEALFTAPAQVTVGENRIVPDVSVPAFTGRIGNVRAAVQ